MIRVLHFVSNMNRGGQETLIMNLYRNIDRNVVQFLFLCTSSSKGDYDEEITTLGGKIFCLPEMKFSRIPLVPYFQKVKQLRIWLSENKDKFDIVHLHTYHACDVLVHLEACRQSGVKKVIIHSHNTQGPHVIFHKMCRQLCKLYDFKRFACGEKAAEWLYGSDVVKKGGVTVIKNGIITANFKYNKDKATEYRNLMGLEGKTIIGHVGRFELQKNHLFLIDIFEQYLHLNPNAVLVLIGRGSLEQNVKDKVNQKHLSEKVRFLGIREDVPALLSMMDIFLFPSLFEGLSVAAIEVQCNGLSMLTSDIPSMREAAVTDLIVFESLDASPHDWAVKLLDIRPKTDRSIYMDQIENAGYSIIVSSNYIQNEYIKYLAS